MEDWHLLDSYTRTGSEAAFAQLVERHLGMVHAAARRQVDDDALADDVAQAVFLLLARKAGSFGPKTVLAGWLFRTTRFVATRALRAEVRRQRREQEAVAMQHLHATDSPWNRLAPELDEAIARLSETDRNALLLRFAEGRNHRDVGVTLGLSEEAAKKRVNRALNKLRTTLAARGVTVTVVLLAGLLTDRLAAAPPTGLAATITQGVVAGVAPTGIAAGLVQQAMAAWRWIRLTSAAALLGVAALVAALLWGPTRTSAPPAVSGTVPPASASPAAAVPSPSSEPPAHVAGVPPRLTGNETLLLRVIAADTGEPLPGARVLLNVVSNGEWITPDDRETGTDGVCVIPLPRGALARLDAGAHVPGYENRYFTWNSAWQHPLPDTHTLVLGRAETVGGQVVDEQQRRLPGITVWLAYRISDTSWREPDEDRERQGFMRRIRLGTTDAQGQWLCSTIPPARTWFAIEFEHPDFVKNDSLFVNREDDTDAGRQTLTRLRSRSQVTTMRAGAVAYGQVVDGNGEPIPGARIGTSWHEPGVLTDQDGQFTMHSLPRGELMFIASAEGYAPRKFRTQAGGEAARVQLDPGGWVRARIVDTHGEPIADASLVLEDGFGDGALGWDGKADADGRVEWRSAPPGRTLSFTAYAPGYRYRRQFPLTADAHQEYTVTLEPDLVVVGRVLDAETGQSITRFKAIPGQGREYPDFERSGLHYGTNGVYQLRFSELGEPVVRVEAEGYETEVGHPERGPNGESRCDFRLRRADPMGGVRGVVLNADGSPAAGADVALCTLETSAMLGRERFLMRDHSIVTNADARGRFAFPVVRTPHTVAAVSALGFGRASVRSNAPVTVRLEPFGEVEGIVLRDGQPEKEKRVALSDPGYSQYSGAVSLDVTAFEALTDAAGRFRIDRVPAGDFVLHLNPGVGIPMTDETHVSVAAGELARVVMGEPDPAGRTVVGRLKSPEPLPVTDWRRHLTTYSLGRKLPVVEPPAGLSEEARQLWRVTWHQSPAGREQARQRRTYGVVVAADGRFTVRGVQPGDYQLWFVALPEEMVRKNPWDQRAAVWRAQVIQPVTIPETDANPPGPDAPVDLGDVVLTIQRNQP